MQEERKLKRVSLLIGEDQYDQLSERGLNVSWLIRDLIDQYFSEKKITLDVSEETLKLYQKVVGLTGGKDEEFENYFKKALHEFLKSKIDEMRELEKNVSNKLELVKGRK